LKSFNFITKAIDIKKERFVGSVDPVTAILEFISTLEHFTLVGFVTIAHPIT